MSGGVRRVCAGRVGRPHGLDGSFHLDRPAAELVPGAAVTVAGSHMVVERVAGSEQRPLVRLVGVDQRSLAERLRGEPLYVDRAEPDLDDDEYLATDLIGCSIAGLGQVRRVIAAPSCDILEVGDEGVLVPLVADAVKRIDTEARVIDVDLGFLGLEQQ